ncbi:MAG: hypothetical protein ACI9Y7_001780 [Dokdonia sp.]|jgi:hypothetical protein
MNNQPKIFIGSSSEGKDVAYAIQENLEGIAEVTIWDQDIFKLSNNYLEDLLKSLDKFDFAILVYTNDDKALIRGDERSIPRDNVVFETGLFMGRLGKDRVYFVTPKGISDFHLLSDLSGISYGQYNSKREDSNLNAALGPFCNKVKKKIMKEPIRAITNKFKIVLKDREELEKSEQNYKCKCIKSNDDTGEIVEENADIKWEPGGLTVTLRNINPIQLVQLHVTDSKRKINMSTEYFSPTYSIRELNPLKTEDHE